MGKTGDKLLGDVQDKSLGKRVGDEREALGRVRVVVL